MQGKLLVFFKTVLIVGAAVILNSSVLGQDSGIKDILTKDFNRYGLTIKYDSIIAGSWENMKYELPSIDSLPAYINLLQKEIEKYPDDFFRKTGINKLVLCGDLRIGKQKRAAVPDAEKGKLYLSVYNSEKFYKESYKIHVFHHELSHCTEFAIWKDYYKKWNKWKRANQKSFKYCNGGTEAYGTNNKTNWRGTSDRKAGFMNLYSTLSQEEDRSEIVAFIMGDRENDTIRKLISEDRILYGKVRLINKLYKRKFNYKDCFLEKRVKVK